MKQLRLALKADRIYLKKIQRIAKMELRDESWLQELESLHARRDIRALNSTALLQSSQKIALDNNIDNQAVRSRCVEVKIRALRTLVAYQKTHKFLKNYIPAKFASLLKDMGGTAAERKAILEYVLNDITDLIERLEHVVNIADIIIEDCDQAGWTLNRINTMLEQKSREK
jgi:hypothetical protein